MTDYRYKEMSRLKLVVRELHCDSNMLTLGCSCNTQIEENSFFIKVDQFFLPFQHWKDENSVAIQVALKGACEIPFLLYDANGREIPDATIEMGQGLPVGNLPHGYARIAPYLLVRTIQGLCIRTCTPVRMLFAHALMVLQLLSMASFRAAMCQLIVPLLRLINRRQIWLTSDRLDRADDNGEALFRYLVQYTPPKVKPVFAIASFSPKYAELRNLGAVVDLRTFRGQLTFLCSVCIASSQASGWIRNPLGPWREYYANLLVGQRYVFLQHGVTHHDVSALFAKNVIHADLICAATVQEHQIFLSEQYGYAPEQVALTGFARFDRLYNQTQKLITVVPTWRRALVTDEIGMTGKRSARPGIESSAYVRNFSMLLHDEIFLQAVRSQGYQIQVLPHPNAVDVWKQMSLPGDVVLLSDNPSYADVLAHSALLITDYSSIAFDFAYLQKPVLYFQFDRDEVFNGSHTFGKQDQSDEGIALGEIAYDANELIRLIFDYLADDCRMKPKYRERLAQTFCFTDRQNAHRIADAIQTLCNN